MGSQACRGAARGAGTDSRDDGEAGGRRGTGTQGGKGGLAGQGRGFSRLGAGGLHPGGAGKPWQGTPGLRCHWAHRARLVRGLGLQGASALPPIQRGTPDGLRRDGGQGPCSSRRSRPIRSWASHCTPQAWGQAGSGTGGIWGLGSRGARGVLLHLASLPLCIQARGWRDRWQRSSPRSRQGRGTGWAPGATAAGGLCVPSQSILDALEGRFLLPVQVLSGDSTTRLRCRRQPQRVPSPVWQQRDLPFPWPGTVSWGRAGPPGGFLPGGGGVGILFKVILPLAKHGCSSGTLGALWADLL